MVTIAVENPALGQIRVLNEMRIMNVFPSLALDSMEPALIQTGINQFATNEFAKSLSGYQIMIGAIGVIIGFESGITSYGVNYMRNTLEGR